MTTIADILASFIDLSKDDLVIESESNISEEMCFRGTLQAPNGLKFTGDFNINDIAERHKLDANELAQAIEKKIIELHPEQDFSEGL
jgi:hypothetical protein